MNFNPLEGLLSESLLPKYPLITDSFNLFGDEDEDGKRLDRKQIVLAPDRFMFLSRHFEELHWCGYVLVQQSVWEGIEKTVRKLIRVTYAGQSTKYTTWMAANAENKLTIPIQIRLDDPKENFWVGFDLRQPRGEDIVDDETALNELKTFENLIYRVRRGDISLRG